MVVSCGLFDRGNDKGSYPLWITAFIVLIIMDRVRRPPFSSFDEKTLLISRMEENMDKSLVMIEYKTADGKHIYVEVSTAVAELLEQSDRQMRSQGRQDRRHLSGEDYIDELTDTTAVYPQTNFADLVIRMDRANRLHAAMKSLSEVQRRRLHLYCFAGLSYGQIGKRENVNHKSISRSVEQALKKLCKHISE